jgi:hypothetical protein
LDDHSIAGRHKECGTHCRTLSFAYILVKSSPGFDDRVCSDGVAHAPRRLLDSIVHNCSCTIVEPGRDPRVDVHVEIRRPGRCDFATVTFPCALIRPWLMTWNAQIGGFMVG